MGRYKNAPSTREVSIFLGQYNIKKNAPRTNMEFFRPEIFFGFGVVASKENADLARRRRIWRLFSATKVPPKTENAILHIPYVMKVQ